MKEYRSIFIGFLSIATLSFASNAMAARVTSLNVINFDANGHIVGQHAEFCNNYQYEGGVQYINAAYSLHHEGGCGDRLAACGIGQFPDPNGPGTIDAVLCEDTGLNVVSTAYLVGDVDPNQLQVACATSGACETIEPVLMVGRGFQLEQIYP